MDHDTSKCVLYINMLTQYTQLVSRWRFTHLSWKVLIWLVAFEDEMLFVAYPVMDK